MDVSSYDVVRGETGYIRRNEERDYTQRFTNQDILDELGTSGMAHLNLEQVRVDLGCIQLPPGGTVLAVFTIIKILNPTEEIMKTNKGR